MGFEKVGKGVLKARAFAADKAVELGKKTAELAEGGMQIASEKAREAAHDVKLAIYRPVMREEFEADGFDVPKMIVVVDEDERKGIEVCNGSVGWLSRKAGMEVLHLYDEATGSSGLRFQPVASCYEVYRQDPFDEGLYVSLSDYLDVMQQNRLTEIKDIARALGARYCKVELCEEAKKVVAGKGNAAAEPSVPSEALEDSLDVSVSGEIGVRGESYSKKELLIEQEFTGSDCPREPELKWFANCEEMKSLVRSRCSDGENSTKRYVMTVRCSTSAAMSLKLAKKIDFALAMMGAKSNFTFRGQISDEFRKDFRIEMLF